MNNQPLNKLRKKLDVIDDHIVTLLDQRMMLAREVAEVKNALGLPLKDPGRESAIIRRLQEKAKNPLLEDSLESIFCPVFDCAKAGRKFMQREKTSFKRIGILGVGLIGGSILRALKARDCNLTLSTLKTADISCGLFDKYYASLEEIVEQVECLILAVPISEILPLASQVAEHAKKRRKPLFVLDVASVKDKIASAFERFTNDKVEFVATHPMAGSEKRGFAHSRSGMFINATWVITPHSRNTDLGIAATEELVEFMGARPVRLEASAHDQYAALVSHVPGILAKSYLEFVKRACPDVENIQGPGFRSFTRIAHSNSRMRQEIGKANRKEILPVLSKWIRKITKQYLGGLHA